MKLAISNIAWPPAERHSVYRAMSRLGFTGLEVAPGLLFAEEPDPFDPREGTVRAVRSELAEFGLILVSAQSLMFGVEGAQLFGSRGEQEKFRAAMGRAIDFTAEMSIPNIVFGSPGNRIRPEGLSAGDAAVTAAGVFREIGDHAQSRGVTVAIEPVPALYGGNFLTDFASTLEMVRLTAHAAIRMNFDIGALHSAGEFSRLADWFDESRDVVSHVHVSEKHLAPAPANPEIAETALEALADAGYKGWISIEMRAPNPFDLQVVEGRLECLSCAAAVIEQGAT